MQEDGQKKKNHDFGVQMMQFRPFLSFLSTSSFPLFLPGIEDDTEPPVPLGSIILSACLPGQGTFDHCG